MCKQWLWQQEISSLTQHMECSAAGGSIRSDTCSTCSTQWQWCVKLCFMQERPCRQKEHINWGSTAIKEAPPTEQLAGLPHDRIQAHMAPLRAHPEDMVTVVRQHVWCVRSEECWGMKPRGHSAVCAKVPTECELI